MSDLEKVYTERYRAALLPLAKALRSQLEGHLENQPRIDRITTRAKSIPTFLEKALTTQDGKSKYSEPLRQIQDQIGARVIVYYLPDVELIGKVISRYYRAIEVKNLVPESDWTFGYFGKHFVLALPQDIMSADIDKSLAPQFFELQIKTLFQHAWSEANHDLGYKPGSQPLSKNTERRLAFSSAQAWGADREFGELFHERNSGSNP